MSDVRIKVERLLIYSKHFMVLHVNSIAHILYFLIFLKKYLNQCYLPTLSYTKPSIFIKVLPIFGIFSYTLPYPSLSPCFPLPFPLISIPLSISNNSLSQYSFNPIPFHHHFKPSWTLIQSLPSKYPDSTANKPYHSYSSIINLLRSSP